jgi:hypothetical protein
MKILDLHHTVLNALSRATELGCDSVALSDLATHVPSSQHVILEAIEAFFSETARLIKRVEIALTAERVPAFKEAMSRIFKDPHANYQNYRASFPLPNRADRVPMHIVSSEDAERQRRSFEIAFPPLVLSKNDIVFFYKTLKSLSKDMLSKADKLKALAA